MVAQKSRGRGLRKLHAIGRNSLAAALAILLGMSGSVQAFEVPTGNEDLNIHWDNTFRYTLASRVREQNKQILGSVNNDDGDRNFPQGIVSSRLDLLTEADAVYKKDFGVRISAAGWYDPLYKGGFGNDAPVGFSNHFANGQQAHGVNSYVRDRYGLDAELLDAFAFGKVDAGEVPISVRVGRHTIYWGEAFFPYAGINGISYGQSPLDLGKALSMPGVELKEIFRPLNQVSVQVQPLKELTIAGQYYLQWESSLFPEGGSYLGMVDPWFNGGESANLGVIPPLGPNPYIVHNAGDRKPHQTGDWGVALRYSPEAINATIGLYYRNFSDKLPQVVSDFAPVGPIPALPVNYHLAYGSDIDLYGISFAKQILGVSVGSEFSYRTNMPLTSTWLAPQGARGDTMHAVVNFLTLLPKTPVFDTGSAILEFTYGRYTKITSDPFNTFCGRSGYSGLDRVTRDNTTVALNLAPEWKQVFSSVDLTMPMSFATGLSGTSAVTGGGAKHNGSYSVGLSFDIVAKYKVDLTYASFFGTIHPDASGQILPPGNAGPNEGAADIFGLLKDRDLLSLTLKATF